jgi:uncharacterized protein
VTFDVTGLCFVAIVFRLIGLLLLSLDLLLWLRFRRQLIAAFPARARLVSWATASSFALAFYPTILMSLAGVGGLRTARQFVPEGLLMASMGLQFAAWFCLVCLGVASLGRLIAKAARWLGSRFRAPVADGSELAADAAMASSARPRSDAASAIAAGRRRFVANGALALPVVAAGFSATGVIASRQPPVVARVRLPVRRELTSLHGLTIAQISDVHVGSYMGAERLSEIRDAVNALGADYHVITGDLIDNDESQLELSTWLVRGLQPKRGEKYLCLGNHEYIAARTCDLQSIMRGLSDAGGQWLIDEARELRVGGHHLWLGGIDYPPNRRFGHSSGRSTRQSLQRMLGQIKDDGAPRIVLSHHPGTFAQARHMPIDLMLSGHTHGGQIKLGRIGDYALTPIVAFEHYHNGLYEYEGRRLYVNAGSGGWLPVRINCPPEITLVELVSA